MFLNYYLQIKISLADSVNPVSERHCRGVRANPDHQGVV